MDRGLAGWYRGGKLAAMRRGGAVRYNATVHARMSYGRKGKANSYSIHVMQICADNDETLHSADLFKEPVVLRTKPNPEIVGWLERS